MEMKERASQVIAAIADIIAMGVYHHDPGAMLIAEATIAHFLEETAAEARKASAERLRTSPANPRYRGKPWVEVMDTMADDIERGSEDD